MAWVKVDDGFPEHPKVIDLDLAALGLWLAGLCYANRQLTDGTLPAGFVRRAGPEAPAAAAQLVAAGLWDDDAAGFRITPGFYERGPSDEIWERSEARRLRDSVIARDGFTCQICGDAVDPDSVHIDHIVPVSRGGRSTVDNLRVTHALCNLRKGAR